MMNAPKNTKKYKGKLSLNLSEPVAEFAQQKADSRFEGNVSLYVRKLIQREMNKQQKAA